MALTKACKKCKGKENLALLPKNLEASGVDGGGSMLANLSTYLLILAVFLCAIGVVFMVAILCKKYRQKLKDSLAKLAK